MESLLLPLGDLDVFSGTFQAADIRVSISFPHSSTFYQQMVVTYHQWVLRVYAHTAKRMDFLQLILVCWPDRQIKHTAIAGPNLFHLS